MKKEPKYNPLSIVVLRNHNVKYRVFEVEGNSMNNSSCNALYDGDKMGATEPAYRNVIQLVTHPKFQFLV
jgi:hypothetical protein